MTLTTSVREEVRQRAGCRCEYCGVHESDVGSKLTIDHFMPRSLGGGDDFENLIYCCICCNQHKHDYWPKKEEDPRFWNPRCEPRSRHFTELEDGTLHALSPSGAFTLSRLRLNRLPLVAYRQKRRQEQETELSLRSYVELNDVLESLLGQQSETIEGLHRLLEEQQQLLRLFLDDGGQ